MDWRTLIIDPSLYVRETALRNVVIKLTRRPKRHIRNVPSDFYR